MPDSPDPRTTSNDDADWMRRYPGAFGARVFEARACWICGEPGYTVPAPPEPITVGAIEDEPPSPIVRTGDTCPGHEYATRRFLAEHPEFASLVSTAKGWRWR